jgi:hypothetical protein
MWPSVDVAGGREDVMDVSSWSVGLSRIVLTIAIHTTAVVLMAFGLETRTRARVGAFQSNPTGGGRFPP